MNQKFEAISASVICKGKEYVFHKGQLLTGESPTDHTLYEIASITKTFTGTLLAQAIVEEKVKLDDDIRLYLDHQLPNLQFNGQPITFKHLVTHHAGLPRMLPEVDSLFISPDWEQLPFQLVDIQQGFSREDFFNELSQIDIDTLPGTEFEYSNTGANLLGYIMESLYRKSFQVLLQERIFKPLEMSSTVAMMNEDIRSTAAEGLNINKSKMPFNPVKGISAEGGILSNTTDMLKYMRYHLNEQDPVIQASHQHLYEGKYGNYEAGFFWQIFREGNNPYKVFQNGGAFGTSSWLTLIPEKDIGVFVVTNVSGRHIHQKLNELVNQIIEEIERDV